MKNAIIAKNKVQSLLRSDKIASNSGLESLIKSEITNILRDYFELDEYSVKIAIDFSCGGADIKLQARAFNVKRFGLNF